MMVVKSRKLREAALIRTKTSPAPGFGAGSSDNTNPSIEPIFSDR